MPDSDHTLFPSRRYTVAELRSLLRQPSRLGDVFPGQFRLSLEADLEVLEIASHARIDCVMPSFLLSAVYYLNSLHPDSEVAGFLDPTEPAENYPQKYECFRSYCLQYREELIELLASRHVQTNALHRCAVLVPALCLTNRMFSGRPCTLIDLGTSAGLHLLCDLYSYSYPELGGRVLCGRFESEVDLEIEFSWKGRKPNNPGAFFQAPEIAERIGVDLAPIDLGRPEQRKWLEAFSPIEDGVLEAFQALQERSPFRLVTGDILEVLEPLANAVPSDSLLVILHSFMTVQFSSEARNAFNSILAAIGAARDLAVISLENELASTTPVELWLRVYRDGSNTDQRLARCQYPLDVGEWLEWLGPID